jgi:hypothetical protein
LVWSFKKTLKASEQEREDIVQARNEWREFQKQVDSKRLVFLDETGAKTNMTRLYGRSLNGERCYDSASSGHWESVTILSSLRLNGSTESIVFDGAVDGKMFDEYINVFLAPTLQPGDIVIADNLRVHKSKNAYDAIKAKRAEFIFLPAYTKLQSIGI